MYRSKAGRAPPAKAKVRGGNLVNGRGPCPGVTMKSDAVQGDNHLRLVKQCELGDDADLCIDVCADKHNGLSSRYDAKKRRPTQFFLLMSVFLLVAATIGCAGKDALLFSQESDPVFVSAERRVVKSYGQTWVAYYYKSETVESLALKVSGSQFFIQEGWDPFKARVPGKYLSSGKPSGARPPDGALLFMTITAGKDFSNPSGLESNEGATVTLLPSSNE
jgi:hypothetical protein